MLHLLVEGGPVRGVSPVGVDVGGIGVVGPGAAGAPGGAAPAGAYGGVGPATAGGRPGASAAASACVVSSSSVAAATAASMTAAPALALPLTLMLSRRVGLVHGIREEGRTGRRLGRPSLSAVSAVIVAVLLLLLHLLLCGHVVIDNVAGNSGALAILAVRARARPRPRRRPEGLLLGQPSPGTHGSIYLLYLLCSSDRSRTNECNKWGKKGK